MQNTVELSLSKAFKRSQRALARWLEQNQGAHQNVFRARASLQALNSSEWTQLVRWLAWLSYAADANGNPALVSRIERLQRSLGRTMHADPAQLAGVTAFSSLGFRRSA